MWKLARLKVCPIDLIWRISDHTFSELGSPVQIELELRAFRTVDPVTRGYRLAAMVRSASPM